MISFIFKLNQYLTDNAGGQGRGELVLRLNEFWQEGGKASNDEAIGSGPNAGDDVITKLHS